jgi:hypothetical protein
MQRIYSSRRLGLLIILFVYILAVFIGLTVFPAHSPMGTVHKALRGGSGRDGFHMAHERSFR